jgi:hypothetical protein
MAHKKKQATAQRAFAFYVPLMSKRLRQQTKVLKARVCEFNNERNVANEQTSATADKSAESTSLRIE